MSTPPPIPTPSQNRNRWYYADAQNQTHGPLTFDELQRLAGIGEIQPETYVFLEGEAEWKAFAKISLPLPSIPNERQPDSWYYSFPNQPPYGKRFGPISSDELKRLAATGTIKPDTIVTKEGETVWLKFSEVSSRLFSSSSLSIGSPNIPIMEAEGDGGTLQLFEEKVCIRRKPGFVSFFTYGAKGDKDIFISQISSVQFKAAGLLTGYIQFTFAGGKEARHGHYEAFSDENTVMFRAEQQWAFQKIKDEIDKRIAARAGGHSQPNTPSYLDELEKLATLRDKGIITPEDFEAKKRHLLGI